MTSTLDEINEARRDRSMDRLGVDLSGCTTIEEAIETADLNWGLRIVEANDVAITTDDGPIATSIPGARFVMRDDNDLTLGVVGHRYEPVDNKNVFSLGEHFLSSGARLHRGGVLDHGRRAFMRFSLPDDAVSVGDDDIVKFSLNIRASHDGTGNVTAGIEGIRQVCTNGMVAAMRGLPHVFNVRHTANVMSRMAEADTILSGAVQYVRGFTAAAQHMLDTPMSRTEFSTFLDGLYPRPDAESKRATTIWENRRAELMNLFAYAETNELGRGTRWAAYNAVTEYLDWSAVVRSTDGSPVHEVRARRQFDRTTQDVKDHAFALANA